MSTFVQAFRKNIQTYTILIALILIWIVFAFATQGGYVSPQNISNLFRQMSVTSLMAAGMVLIIVTGGIDLSVGRLAGFVSVVVAFFQANRWNTVFPDQPAEHLVGIGNNFVQVQYARGQDLLATKRQKLACERGRPPSGLVNLGEQVSR